MKNSILNAKEQVFSTENGADRHRSMVSSSFRQGQVNFAQQ